MKFILSLLLIVSLSFVSFGQDDEFVYENKVYVDYIKSVKFTHAGLVTSLPIINLGSSGRLELSFDDVDGGWTEFTYKVIYCNKDWTPSDLPEDQYVESFDNDFIEQSRASAGTFLDYTNYTLIIPNDDVRWTKSGNYLLVVYNNDGAPYPVITRRFLVVEPSVSLIANMTRPIRVSEINTHQQVEFTVDFKNFNISSPLQEIEAVVMQNGRWDTALTGIRPKFVNGEKLFFDKTARLTFPANKEFRNFDTRSLRFTSEGVNSIDIDNNEIYVLLNLESKRTFNNFLTEIDLNGFYIIETRERNEPDTEAQYANVIFSLEDPRLRDEEDIYVVGEFTDWSLKEEFRMYRDQRNNIYSCEAFLKQGIYDYTYVVHNTKTKETDFEILEGNWYETENDYVILIYFSNFSENWDRLIAVSIINSNR